MSAIDFRTSVTRKTDPKGDRVVITLDGKVSLSNGGPEGDRCMKADHGGLDVVLALFVDCGGGCLD